MLRLYIHNVYRHSLLGIFLAYKFILNTKPGPSKYDRPGNSGYIPINQSRQVVNIHKSKAGDRACKG